MAASTVRFFSTCLCINAKNTSRQQFTMLNKLLDRSSKKVLKAISSENFSQPVVAREGKIYSSHESRRQIVLNKLLLEHLCDLMANGDISKLLTGTGLEVIKVQTTRNYSVIKVFWCCDGKSNPNEVQRILDANASKLRSELIKQHILGTVPYIQFFYDKTRMSKQRIIGLLDKVKSELNIENDFVPNHWRQIPVIKTDKIEPNVEFEAINETSRDLGEMTHDVYDLDRAAMMKIVMERCNKKKDGDQREVKNVYEAVNSIRSDRNKHFEKFLQERKKRRSNKEKNARDLVLVEPSYDEKEDFYEEDDDDEYPDDVIDDGRRY